MQGDSAPAEIEAALEELNAGGLVDVIVLARGGGSLEDLAAFNSERVARAIASSSLPVVSAVGHETDFTIADFVADLRAPTPSAAAELITEAQHKIAEHLADADASPGPRRPLPIAASPPAAHPPARQPRRRRAWPRCCIGWHSAWTILSFRMEAAVSAQLRQHQRHVADLAAAVLRHDPRQRLAQARERLAACRTRLDRSLERSAACVRRHLSALDARLHSLSPLAVLERGYALVLDAGAALIRSANQIAPGDQLITRLSDGAFISRVESTAAAGKTAGSPRKG